MKPHSSKQEYDEEVLQYELNYHVSNFFEHNAPLPLSDLKEIETIIRRTNPNFNI